MCGLWKQIIESRVARETKPCVLLMHCPHAIVLKGESITQLARPVGRPVVDEQHLEHRIRLFQNGADAPFKIASNVVNGHDKGYFQLLIHV